MVKSLNFVGSLIEPVTTVTSKPFKKRLNFIDAARAVAIIKMLEGHFVRVVLKEEYRDHLNPIYQFWYNLSGITAPLFFTISGLVFVFLLSKSDAPIHKNPMAKKGLKRFAELMIWGHLLQASIPAAINGYFFNDYLIAMHVLQCIGVSIFLLIVFFWVHKKVRIISPALIYFFAGVSVFWTYPFIKDAEIAFLPHFFANFFNKVQGSIFPLFPWSGYVFFGGALGYLVSRNYQKHFKKSSWYMAGTGLFLIFFGMNWFVDSLNFITGHWINGWVKYSDFLFKHLGKVIFFIACLMLLENYVRISARQRAQLEKFLIMGRKTFFIYIVHVILLYGGIFGVGIKNSWRRDLGPWETALGTLLFILFFAFLSNHHDALKARWKRVKAVVAGIFVASRRSTQRATH